MTKIPIEISARHMHISQADLNTLFGDSYQLTPIKDLSQKGQFAAQEEVEIQTSESWGVEPHMDFTFGKAPDHNRIRILGPVRDKTQVELSATDFRMLDIKPAVCLSGEHDKTTGGVYLVGPKGQIFLKKGLMIAKPHIHCNKEEARDLSLEHGQKVKIKIVDDGTGKEPARQIIFNNVIVRVDPSFSLHMHIDTDEANAAGIAGLGQGVII